MNREIKFRVWDKKNNRWASVRGILLNRTCPSKIYSINHPEDLERFAFQQFTGLKDKNDKDIYEGDILRARHQLGFDGIGRCEFVNGCFEFVAIDKEKMRTSYGGAKDIRISDFIGDKTRVDIEVVGNIFENPELCAN